MELRLLLLQGLKDAWWAAPLQLLGWVGALTALLAMTAWPWLRPGSPHPLAFRGVLMAFIVWTRLPALLLPLQNPDEGQFAAAAQRLLDDPVFWRSVDTGSSGPLNVLPLLAPALFGFSPELASSRLMGLLMAAAAVALLHAAIGRLWGERLARLAILPVACSFAFMEAADFVHYSSEHVPLLLTAAMVYGLARADDATRALREGAAAAPWPAWLGVGLLAGAMPYAKLQGLPIAAVLWLSALHLAWRARSTVPLAGSAGAAVTRHAGARVAHSAGALVAGGLLPSVVVAASLWHFDIVPLFWQSYLQTNLFQYSQANLGGTTSKLGNLIRLVLMWPPVDALAVLTALCVLCLVLLAVVRRRERGSIMADPAAPPWMRYALATLAAALYAVAKPGNTFPHYVLLLVIPMGWVLAAALSLAADPANRHRRTDAGLLAAGLLAAALLPAYERLEQPYGPLALKGRYLARYRGPVEQAIRRAAPPGSTASVWGFSPHLCVESGMRQATRYGNTFWQIEPHPLQDDFIREWVADFRAARPLLFIDAMAPGMFYMRPILPALHRHEAIPAVRALIEADYELVETVRGVRIYRRLPGR